MSRYSKYSANALAFNWQVEVPTFLDIPLTHVRFENTVSAVPSDFFDLPPEQQVIVLVDGGTVRLAERLIESCEHCNEGGAETPFDAILDRVTDSDPVLTDYILEVAAQCPNCRREILEKTLVEPARG
jgi:hypothetical protein